MGGWWGGGVDNASAEILRFRTDLLYKVLMFSNIKTQSLVHNDSQAHRPCGRESSIQYMP